MNNLNTQIQSYLQFCSAQKKLDSKTVKAYRIDLRQYEEFIKQERLTVSKESLAIFIAKMNESYSPRSVKRKIASLKAFFNYLEDEDLLDKNPFNKLHVTLREPSRLPRTIPLRVIESILTSAHNAASVGMTQYARKNALRDAAVMELLFATGMRVSELSHLDISDIDLNDGTVMIYGKGAKERLIHIGSSDVLSILNEYYHQFGSPITGPFFLNRTGSRLSEQSVRGIINKYATAVCANMHITPHMFRHSFASLLLEEDVDIRYIQQMLGHSSITTTQIYTHVTISKQKDILMNKHPRNKMTL